jgi:hypothetical protein
MSMATKRLIPTKFPDAELQEDARTIRRILRKYSPDPRQYSAALPLHPATLEWINRTRCLSVADVLACMYEREYIYAQLNETRADDEENLCF